MAMLNQEQVRGVLQELSAKGGGSLVKRVHKSEINDTSRVLFVGLGGMGCQTINAIKSIYQREYNTENAARTVRFLAVDTATNELDELMVGVKGGYLTKHETFALYDEDAQRLLIHRPPVVEQWLSDQIRAEDINPDGAKQTRAIGRVMLCATGKYDALEETIKSELNMLRNQATPNDIVTVVLVAGISGGTGSGTFIDIGFMIQQILERYSVDFHMNKDFYGLFYTPDVQKSNPAIGEHEDTWKNLQRNGYAALKELDYFINVGNKAMGSEVIYSLELPGREPIKSTAPLFEQNRVFLISTSPNLTNWNEIIQCTAASLLNLFQTGKVTQQNGAPAKKQSVISTMSNVTQVMGTWNQNHVGKPASNNEPADPCGNYNSIFPVFMNYSFSSLGYRSIYFPRNEMVAYCANKLFMHVYKNWTNAFGRPEKAVQEAADSCGVGSEDAIYANILSALSVNLDNLRISVNDNILQAVKMFGLGSYTGIEETKDEAKRRALAMLKAIEKSLSGAAIKPMVDKVKAYMEDQRFLAKYGPFGAITMLSGESGRREYQTNTHGIIGMLETMAKNNLTAVNDCKKALNEAIGVMDSEAQMMSSDHTPTKTEMEDFLKVCWNYSKALLKAEFFKSLMPKVLKALASELNKYNSETFHIYVPVIHAVKDILNEDSEAFMDGTLRMEGYNQVYSIDAYHVDRAETISNQFSALFEGYFDETEANNVARKFAKDLFGPGSRDVWSAFRPDDPLSAQAMADEIRALFHSAVKPLVTQMLEKFVVLAYADPQDIQRLTGKPAQTPPTIDDLNTKIWPDVQTRQMVMDSAAQKIVNCLMGSLMIEFSVPTNLKNEFATAISLVLLAETPELNAAILRKLQGKHVDHHIIGSGTTCDSKTAISMTMSICPFPLAQVRYMNDYAKEYFASGNRAGRHLDEITEQWQTYLPEPYGVDAEEYFSRMWHMRGMVIPEQIRTVDQNGRPVNNDREMYDKLRDAIDYGIQKGYIQCENNRYSIVVIRDEYKTPEFLRRLEEKVQQLQAQQALLGGKSEEITWITALFALQKDDHLRDGYHNRILFDSSVNSQELISKQHVFPDNNFELKNLYRLVRYNMNNARLVLKEKAFYEKTGFLDTVSRMSGFEEAVTRFVHAYKLGMISVQEDRTWVCKYSDYAGNAPVPFFRDHLRKVRDFDDILTWYLVISAFSGVTDSHVCSSIDTRFKTADDTGDYASMYSVEHILQSLESALNTPMLSNTVLQKREEEVMFRLMSSKYRAYYSFPRDCVDSSALIENVQKVIDVFNRLDISEGLGTIPPVSPIV